MQESIPADLVRHLRRRKGAVAFTGAGMSVESGIPPFTGPGGLWERMAPEEYAHVRVWRRDPAKAWVLFRELLAALGRARPHAGHLALARLEEMGMVDAVITQNVDGLHQRSGSSRVIELHGSAATLVCEACGNRCPADQADWRRPEPRCPCGAWWRPDVVLYGEPLPAGAMDEAGQLVEGAGLLLVVGAACRVYPAARIPDIAAALGIPVLEINAHEEALDPPGTWHLRGGAMDMLHALAEAVEQGGEQAGPVAVFRR